jgi:hypothetical protein
MKKLALALLVACLLVAGEAAAEPTPKKSRPTLFGKLDAWNVALAASHLLPSYFLQIAAHEGVGHALPITLAGGKVTRVTILPERHGDGTWSAGSTEFEGTFTPVETAFITLGPHMADVFLFTLTETLFASGAVPYGSPLAPILLVTGEFWPWWDFTSSLLNPSPANDLSVFEHELHVHPAITRTIGGVISAGGLVLMTMRLVKMLVLPKSAVKPTVKVVVYGLGLGITVRF